MLHHMLRAAAQRAFSTLDPYFKYVTMLLHGDGSALGSDTVTPFNSDASTNAFNVTINGDARSNNFNPYQAGYYSNYFDGSGDYLTAPSGAAVSGTGAFTVEFWVLMTASQTYSRIVSGAANNITINLSSNGDFDYGKNGVNSIIATNVGSVLNVWTHVCVARSAGGTARVWVNGTSIGTATDSNSYTAATVYIGATSVPSFYLTGFLSNLRTTNTDVYGTSNTTITVPTAPLSAVSGTSLLTCQSNRFIDNSASPLTITVNGNTSIAPTQPFTLPSSVATYGSGYFDGSGDYLSVADNTALNISSGDFTVECWFYGTNSGVERGIVSRNNGNFATGNDFQYNIYIQSGGSVVVRPYSSTTDYTIVVGTVVLNQWNHVALVRTGSTFYGFLNGVRSATTQTIAGSLNNGTWLTYIGASLSSSLGNVFLTGYATDVRIVKGTAVYTGSTYTVPTAPLTAITNTSLLTTQYNGAGNNNGFKDSSQNNFPITRNGNTTQGTFTPYGSNWSNYFNGSNQYVSVPANTAFAFGTGDFTIECWVYLNAYNGTYGSQLAGAHTYAVAADFLFNVNTTGKLYFQIGGTSTGAITSTTSVPLNTWTHIAMVRASGVMTPYINGANAGGGATYSSSIASTIAYSLGDDASGNAGSALSGYISNHRTVKGTAVYTGAFTPSTTPLTAISGTSLLTCQSNRFVDNSSNAFSITAGNSPSVQRFSPFSPTTAYSTSVIGGSAYFDGSDYLAGPSNSAFAFGTGDFTMECWLYPTSFSGTYQTYISTRTGTGTGADLQLFNGTTLMLGNQSGAIISANNVLTLNTWQHIAVTRSGTTNRLFVNGAIVASGTASDNFTSSGCYISSGQGGGNNYAIGYITDARLVKGTAVYTAAFTPSTAPLTAISGTSILLSATNAGILDNAMMNDLETVGNAQISTSVKKYGTGSMYFDGSGDYLVAPYNPNLVLGSGDFTVEMWLYKNADVAYMCAAGNMDSSAPYNTKWQLFADSPAGTKIQWWSDAPVVISTSTLSTGVWYHVAVARASGTTRIFINGALEASASDTRNYSAANQVWVGQVPENNSGRFWNGYIDDLRITKVARYTTTFTPPTAAFPNN